MISQQRQDCRIIGRQVSQLRSCRPEGCVIRRKERETAGAIGLQRIKDGCVCSIGIKRGIDGTEKATEGRQVVDLESLAQAARRNQNTRDDKNVEISDGGHVPDDDSRTEHKYMLAQINRAHQRKRTIGLGKILKTWYHFATKQGLDLCRPPDLQ